MLDGEVAIYDQQLRSRFEWLREADPDAVATPPVLIAFDLLYTKGPTSASGHCASGMPGSKTARRRHLREDDV